MTGVRGVVYHLLPDWTSGTRLWPLASLARVDPAAYAAGMRKYADRLELLYRPVEPLRCTWQDCVFLCPVDPRQLMEAARIASPDLPSRDWIVIDAELLDVDKTVLFKPYQWASATGPPPITAQDCESVTSQTLAAASAANEVTLTRLADPSNRMPLFADVIHVLHRGPIKIETARTLTA